MGLFSSSSKSSTSNTTNNYDQRVVNDNSGAGTADNGAIATTVQGSGNVVTDSGAFAIVDKLVSTLGKTSELQTTVARDIALTNTQAGMRYAEASANAETIKASASIFSNPAAVAGLAAVALAAVLLLRK